MLILAKELDKLPDESVSILKKKAEEVSMIISGLIRSLN
jgi:hypothetical protein